METDPQLLESAVAGDVAAIETLLLGCYDVILKHIEFKFPEQLSAKSSPQDILQDAFARAFQAIGSFRPSDKGSFTGWLRRIADNVLTDEIRKNGRDRRIPRPEAPAGESSGSLFNFIDGLDGGVPEPHIMAGRDELVRAAQVALASMEPRYQEAILVCGIRGQSYDELAEALHVSTDAARGIYVRARQKLKQEIVRLSRYV